MALDSQRQTELRTRTLGARSKGSPDSVWHHFTLFSAPCAIFAPLMVARRAVATGWKFQRILALLIFVSLVGYALALWLAAAVDIQEPSGSCSTAFVDRIVRPFILSTSVCLALTWGFGYLLKNKPSALTLGVKQISANVGGEIFGALPSTANIDSGLIIRRAFRTIVGRTNLESQTSKRLPNLHFRHAPMHWLTDHDAFVSLNYLIDPRQEIACLGVSIQKMLLDYSLHHCLDLVTSSDRSRGKNVSGGCSFHSNAITHGLFAAHFFRRLPIVGLRDRCLAFVRLVFTVSRTKQAEPQTR